MSKAPPPIIQLLHDDPRYTLPAYVFVREALDFAHRAMGRGPQRSLAPGEEPPPEAHLTGQQLCEAVRQFALQQYGYLAKLVLNSWGIRSTSDIGEIVYNLIAINVMKKSESDRRQDFDDVYDFEQVFVQDFVFTVAR
jgi:uncharacterized repeat protein (TIGR04138 family)